MGSTAHIVIVGQAVDGPLNTARERLEALEARWTRFSPQSELSRLNASAGRPTIVSPDTYRLVETAVTAWRETGGRYDPTMLGAIAGLGYDRTFADIVQAAATNEFTGSSLHTTAGDIVFDPSLRAVTLPEGIGIDPGGIGKGLAGDILVEELLDSGAAGAMVNVGGDVRVAGASPCGDTWPISIADPLCRDRELLRIEISEGAVATSNRLERSWTDANENHLHHLLDPATGRPVNNEIAAVTVVAGEGWWAEALTKTVFTAGTEDGLDHLKNASGIIVDLDGRLYSSPDLEPAVR